MIAYPPTRTAGPPTGTAGPATGTAGPATGTAGPATGTANAAAAACGLAAVGMWGLAPVATRALVLQLAPLPLLVLRMTVAAIDVSRHPARQRSAAVSLRSVRPAR